MRKISYETTLVAIDTSVCLEQVADVLLARLKVFADEDSFISNS